MPESRSPARPGTKGVFTPAHAIPLEYWITTRMIAGYYVAVVHRFGWQLLLLALTGAGLREGAAFLLSWLSFKVAYELGYITNDFWSEEREKRADGTNRGPGSRLSMSQLTTLVAPRVLTSLGLAVALLFVARAPQQAYASYWIMGLAAGVFLTHNVLAPKYRGLTYFLLHVCEGAVVLPFVGDRGLAGSVAVWACVIVPALTSAAHYLAHKGNPTFLPYKNYLVQIVTQLRIGAVILFGCFAVLWIVPGRPGIVLPGVILYDLGFDWLVSWITFRRSTRRSVAQRRVLQHLHSNYSHDSSVTLEDVKRSSTALGFETCFITEHAEDFNARRFEEYRADIAAVNQRFGPGCDVVAGLEFPILQQHILACNLRSFVAVDGTKAQDIDKVRDHCAFVVWAHPMVAVKRLWTWSYLSELFQIASRVDGVEWASGKSDRPGRYFAWRHLGAAFVMHVIWPHKQIAFGYDLHTQKDWDALYARLGAQRR